MSGIGVVATSIPVGVEDTIKLLFFKGPTWDGDLPNKTARDYLVMIGLVSRGYGYNWLTNDGVEAAVVTRQLHHEKEKLRVG